MSATNLRPLPVVTTDNAFFWTAGEDGVLRFRHCNHCDALLHPPVPVCRYCRSDDIGIKDVSGRGIVVGATVNRHAWDPAFPPPHSIALIAIEEDPRVRLISNVVDVAPELVEVGARVKVRFEHDADVWVPYFELDGGEVDELPADEIGPEDHLDHINPMVRTDKFEDRAVITGIGMSQVGRRLMRPAIALTVEAIKEAVADAGLELSDIDGLSTYPGADLPGMAEGGVSAVEDALGIRPVWYTGGMETFGPSGSVISAAMAVAAGLVRHVVCFRTVWEATFAAQQRAAAEQAFANADPSAPAASGPPPRRRVGGYNSYSGPFGVSSAANNLALYASHHFKKYGTTRETLGWVALNQRANAMLNPKAIYRDPMSMDDYLSARMISDPFGLYDCDVPMDGAIAVVVSARETAGDLRQKPIYLEAVGTQMTERIAWEQSTLTHEPQVLGPAAHLWTRTSLRPDDVQVAELYDGFSFNCVSWLEGLGFCGIGEAKDFLEGGRNIARDGGNVALNTHGGQLSAGRTHGMGLVHEAVTQLRGDGGERQVANARVAVVSSGGLTPSGAYLLRSDA
ncbi:MAG: acetyl-CoA acetyltransferase [Actinomycetia bacterium]|nr:acetyl-CoA acetyltransferase [Actinomycetes bacterium]